MPYAGFLMQGSVSSVPEPAASRREELQVRGVVQGVGFRPFVYRLALQEGLSGFIGNDTDGVIIEVEGPSERIAAFRARLTAEAPPLSRIDSIIAHGLSPKQEKEFRIVASAVHGQVSTGIPADAATCADCLRELFDPTDRRYRYPFLNCTNCGPRFTITRRIPYDRSQTSMARFTMCAACQAEYDDPTNRRFHAQPNACPVCGPRVWMENLDGNEISCADPITASIDRLIGGEILAGEILAIKGIGGFHLSVDATNEAAVMRLRQRKHRYGKPLAVMVRDLHMARALCELSPEEESLLTTPARPILLARRRPDARVDANIAPSVAPGIPWLGIFLPYAPLQHLLLADPRVHALVMTSANLSEEPIAIDNDEARARLGQIADAFLMHDREILQRCDDSVIAVVDGVPQFVRRARGFVPLGIPLPLGSPEIESPPLLAVGGHLKNVFTLARGRFAYQSQHLGDLENVTGFDFFRESLAHLMQTFEIEPQFVVHDLHPGYLSTQWAKEWAAERGLPLIGVQHHHAHIAACMAEHELVGPVIGLALDGTGYGTDERIWGGEVLVARLDGFDRFAHLDYAPMPGSEKAIREPWRMALGALTAAGIDSELAAKLTGTTPQQARVIEQMVARNINTPLTSSLGRLFDVAAVLVLGRRLVDYEAQAAIELEGLCALEPAHLDRMDYIPELIEGRSAVLRTARLWLALVDDLLRGVSRERIASYFHSGIAEGFVAAAMRVRDETGIGQVAMSGGCLHNRRMASLLRLRLREEGFQVYQHRKVSPGDGGLSYGQAVVAAMLQRK